MNDKACTDIVSTVFAEVVGCTVIVDVFGSGGGGGASVNVRVYILS